MMMNNIIVTGCSYSQSSGVPREYIYSSLLNKHRDIQQVKNLSWPGQSNDTIIRDTKKQIEDGVTNTLFICQLTHLHRVSHFCNINKKWLDFQPAIINPYPEIKNDKVQFDIEFYDGKKRPQLGRGNIGSIGIYGAQKWNDLKLDEDVVLKLLNWYETYLMYLYDEEHEFFELHKKINELTKQIKDSNNEILYLYWPDIIYDKSLFNKNNFLSIDGEYSMLKWSVKNKLNQEKDTHLSLEGHSHLANSILSYLNLNPQHRQIL